MRLNKLIPCLALAVLLPTGALADGENTTLFPPNTCKTNPGAVEAWLKNWRRSMRAEKAKMLAQNMDALVRREPLVRAVPPNAKCIKGEDTMSWDYNAAGDFFTISCLMQTKGVLSHVISFDVGGSYGECISDQTIKNMLQSKECQTYPDWPAKWFSERVNVGPCLAGFWLMPGQGEPLPLFQGHQPQVTVIDVNKFNELLNQRPGLRSLVDEQSRRVKGSGNNGSGCSNPLGCLPPTGVGPSSNSAE